MIAVLAPGQGSQSPGMLTPWLGRPGAVEVLQTWSAAAGLDLVRLGTTADATELRDTAVAQPLLTATALLSTHGLDLDRVGLACGHSIGEIAVLALAGVLKPLEAIALAAARGRAMAEAAGATATGMAAVLGGDEPAVRQAIGDLGLEIATINAPGQVVVGGPQDRLDRLTAAPPAGARVRPLATAGAFHTSAMAPAVPVMRSLVDRLSPQDARFPVVANADGRVLTDGRELVDRLVAQLTGPVRFDLCLETIAAFAPSQVIELAPAGTLTGIARRVLDTSFSMAEAVMA